MIKDPKLVPGMFARLSLPLGSSPGILIPQEAVHQVGQLTMVKVVVDGQAQLAPGENWAGRWGSRWKSWRGCSRGPDYMAEK